LGNQTEVRKNFGPKAASYRFSSTHGNPQDLQRMIDLLKPFPEANALDVATGGGHTAIALAKSVQHVVAIDITPEMLHEARNAAIHQGIGNIEFLAQDVHSMDFADSHFDIVASRFAVHHFFDVMKALKEMCRVLKTGGQLYILDCTVFDGEETEKVINHIEYLRDSSHQFAYSPRLWYQILKELPLAVEYTGFIRADYKLPEWFERIGTSQEKIDEIYEILRNLSANSKRAYPFGDDYIASYRFEILASKK
jgi:ubiquinone/menaquinone biosynthesis C-methylase UbiE